MLRTWQFGDETKSQSSISDQIWVLFFSCKHIKAFTFMVYLTLITYCVVLWAIKSILNVEHTKVRLALWKCGEHRLLVFIGTHIKL